MREEGRAGWLGDGFFFLILFLFLRGRDLRIRVESWCWVGWGGGRIQPSRYNLLDRNFWEVRIGSENLLDS